MSVRPIQTVAAPLDVKRRPTAESETGHRVTGSPITFGSLRVTGQCVRAGLGV